MIKPMLSWTTATTNGRSQRKRAGPIARSTQAWHARQQRLVIGCPTTLAGVAGLDGWSGGEAGISARRKYHGIPVHGDKAATPPACLATHSCAAVCAFTGLRLQAALGLLALRRACADKDFEVFECALREQVVQQLRVLLDFCWLVGPADSQRRHLAGDVHNGGCASLAGQPLASFAHQDLSASPRCLLRSLLHQECRLWASTVPSLRAIVLRNSWCI